MEKKISEQKAKIENLLKQIVDVKKDKITETQKLSIELSKLKVNNNLLSKELEATKKAIDLSINKKWNTIMIAYDYLVIEQYANGGWKSERVFC